MKRNSTSKRIVGVSAAVFLLAVTAALAGCGGGKTPTVAEKVAATAEKAAAGAQKAAEQLVGQASATKPAATATAPAAKPAATGAEETISVDSREAGLEKLTTYRARWRGEWTATEAGVTQRASWDGFEEIAREAKARHWRMKITKPETGEVSQFEFWQIADVSYLQAGSADVPIECIMVSNDAQQSEMTALFSPDAFGQVSGARYVNTETVNDIRAKHYRYDEKGASLAGFGRVTGDMWVAVDGGYVVKEVMNWEGVAGPLAANSKAVGKGTWTFEVFDVNKPLTIKPPEACAKFNADLPILPDATEQSRIGPMIMYKTATKATEVVEFYQREMAKAGWKVEGKPQISDMMSSLNFRKGDNTAQITIMPSDDKTQVLINLGQK